MSRKGALIQVSGVAALIIAFSVSLWLFQDQFLDFVNDKFQQSTESLPNQNTLNSSANAIPPNTSKKNQNSSDTVLNVTRTTCHILPLEERDRLLEVLKDGSCVFENTDWQYTLWLSREIKNPIRFI